MGLRHPAPRRSLPDVAAPWTGLSGGLWRSHDRPGHRSQGRARSAADGTAWYGLRAWHVLAVVSEYAGRARPYALSVRRGSPLRRRALGARRAWCQLVARRFSAMLGGAGRAVPIKIAPSNHLFLPQEFDQNPLMASGSPKTLLCTSASSAVQFLVRTVEFSAAAEFPARC